MTSRNELIDILKNKYPDAWFKQSEDFDGTAGAIWTGEGSFDADGIPLFEYWSTSSLYQMGVLKELADLLSDHGWYSECHDAGTYMLFKL